MAKTIILDADLVKRRDEWAKLIEFLSANHHLHVDDELYKLFCEKIYLGVERENLKKQIVSHNQKQGKKDYSNN